MKLLSIRATASLSLGQVLTGKKLIMTKVIGNRATRCPPDYPEVAADYRNWEFWFHQKAMLIYEEVKNATL
jgi:hypothetical protein